MTLTKGMEAIKELSVHSLSWYNEGNIKTNDKELQTVLNQIDNFENNMNIITEEVRMAQHKGLANAITIRSGLNYKPPKNPLENITTSQKKPATKENTIKNGEKGPDNPRKSVESYDDSIPFPG
ncbi:hypothetical protein Tco_0180719 [Tanacetum coccineum]